MAFVVGRGAGRWELRESHATPSGPRSRTLASFRTLTPEVLVHARERSRRPLDEAEIRAAARRAGAPVSAPSADGAAAALLAELAAGAPRGALAALLLEALDAGAGEVSDSARAAARWASATAAERGETLRDLLALTDRLPADRRAPQERFPRLSSAAA